MRSIKNFSTIIIWIVIIFLFFGSYNQKILARNFEDFNETEKVIKAAVLFSTYDEYMNLMREALVKVEQENLGRVQINFYNAESDQQLQNRQLDGILKKKQTNLIFINLVKHKEAKYIIDRVKENNIPMIFFGGTDIKTIKTYNKAYWIGMNSNEGGTLQGQVIVDLWNRDKLKIDRNRDNILQYIMIKGPLDDMYAIGRTKNSILTVNNAGIKTKELESVVSNWSEEEAKNSTKYLISRFANNIEMVIANNDAMAIGAIKALQEQGYNIEGKVNLIPVIGFDATPKAQELINKGVMAGTVMQEHYDYAKAFYTVGMNLVNNREPLYGTDYKSDDGGVSIILKYKGVMIYNIK